MPTQGEHVYPGGVTTPFGTGAPQYTPLPGQQQAPGPVPGPSGALVNPYAPAAPVPAPEAARRRAPSGPPPVPDLPPMPGGPPKPQPVEVPGPPPTPGYQRPADAASRFFSNAKLGAFDPRLRGRSDVQEAIRNNPNLDSGTSLYAGMAGFGTPTGAVGITPGFNPKKQEDETVRMGGLQGVMRALQGG